MFVDPNFVDNPTSGDDIVTAWGDIVRDDLMALAAPPSVKVVRTTAQSIPDGSDTAVEWTDVQEDTHSMWSPTAPTELVVPTGWPGGYLVDFGAGWQINTVGLRHAEVFVFGSRVAKQDTKDTCSTGECDHSLSLYLPNLAVGSHITARVRQASGGYLDLVAFDDSLSMSVRWVRLPTSYAG